MQSYLSSEVARIYRGNSIWLKKVNVGFLISGEVTQDRNCKGIGSDWVMYKMNPQISDKSLKYSVGKLLKYTT